jgi:succinate dehydrogenase/fumarate reductase flavoprotein subunit
MWDYVGIVRTTKRLQRAQNRIRLLIREIDDFYSQFRVSHDLIELRNLVVTADLIIRCALRRHESRGLHFSRNYPETLERARNTVLRRRPRLIAGLPANAATGAADETALRHAVGQQEEAPAAPTRHRGRADDQLAENTVSACTRRKRSPLAK